MAISETVLILAGGSAVLLILFGIRLAMRYFLYAVIDYGRAVCASAKTGTFIAIPVVTRSALDAYADIANLCDHPAFQSAISGK